MLRIPKVPVDERRKRKLMRLWWDFCDDAGEFVAVFIGLVLALGAIAILWLAAVQIEQWIKHSIP